jgi:GT2 family glycosyltransferase
MQKRIDVGIVNYNGGLELIKCIETILGLRGVDVNVLVADNASTDGSAIEAKKRFPQCTYLLLETNSGYAGACNYLIPHLKTDVIVLCNMDLEFDPDWGKELLDCFTKNPQAAAVSTAVYEKETGRLYSGGVFFYNDLYPLSSESLKSNEPYDVFGSYGAIMAFRRDVFKKTGMFDKDYFLFFEETEFYLRMNVFGLRTIFCPSAKVYHHRSVSTIRYSPLKLYYSERNRMMTAYKYFPLWYFPFVFIISAYRILLMAKKGVPGKDGQGRKVSKFTIVFTIGKAWLDALRFIPRETKKRMQMWKKSEYSPAFTLELIRKYKLRASELRVK